MLNEVCTGPIVPVLLRCGLRATIRRLIEEFVHEPSPRDPDGGFVFHWQGIDEQGQPHLWMADGHWRANAMPCPMDIVAWKFGPTQKEEKISGGSS